MKNFLVLIVTTFLAVKQPNSTTFKVCFIKEPGQILFAKDKRPVRFKDVLHLEDQLIFKDRSAKLVVINPKRGSLDVTWRGIAKDGGMISELRELLLPSITLSHMDSRGIDFHGYDPKTYFDASETRNKVLLVDGLGLPVDSHYVMNEQNFFFVQYMNNEKPITFPVKVSGHTLVFNRLDFPQLNGQIAAYDYEICYQSTNNGKPGSISLGHFIPVMPEVKVLSEQMDMIKNCFSYLPVKKKNAVLLDFLYDNYGKIGLESLPSDTNK